MLILGWVVMALLATSLIPLLWATIFPRSFAGSKSSAGGETWPEVTVIVPARDEGTAIRDAMESILRLDYPHLRIVYLDDRSQDETGRILDELAEGDDRVTVTHIAELPVGWLGKNHANWVGARDVRSPWLLFTDADIQFAPDALRRALRHVTAIGIDHLTLLPGMIPGKFWENLMVCTFGFLFALRYPAWLVRSRLRHWFVGVGAFNLIRNAAYEQIGGHRRLAMEVADDVKLGKLVKAHGLRQDVLDGSSLLVVRWQQGLRGVIHGLTKNSFAVMNYSVVEALLTTIVYLSLFCLPYVGSLLVPGSPRVGFLVATLLIELAFAALVWRSGRSVLLALFLPLSLPLFLYIIWRSVFVTLHQGGVIWRDTFYPLEELRKGLV